MKKILLAALLCAPFIGFAQRHHEIGLVGGIASYNGDLQQKTIPNQKFTKPAIGIMYKYFFNPHVGIRASANYMQLTGADSLSSNTTQKLRNLSFGNDIYELYAGIEYNFVAFGSENFKVTPYIFGGVGAFYGDPYAEDKYGVKIHLRDLGTEGQGLPMYPNRDKYSLVNASFPFGGGVKFMIGKSVILGAEFNLRYTSTDYIDDVSQSYVNMDSLFMYKGAKAVEMSYRGVENPDWDGNYPNYKFQRGDYKGNDWYWTLGLTATIRLNSKPNKPLYYQSRCPRIFGIGLGRNKE